ncbi:MAG: PorV/PorQ family protein [Candidatus Zixiibacteriota bacterium]
MKYKLFILTMVLLVVSLNLAYAGNNLRLGTAGAQELRIPVGSRGVAMGGAVIADARGVESVFWNPAGLANTPGTQVMFMHHPYIADINVNFVGVATRIEDFGTIAAAAKIVSIGDIKETTEDAPFGTGRFFSPSLSVMSLSYSRLLTGQVAFGANALFISEKIADMSASGMAFDIGIMFDPNWNGLTMGMVIKNYGPQMSFSGHKINIGDRPGEPTSSKFELPSTVDFGMSLKVLEQDRNIAKLNGNFRSNNFGNDQFLGGAEYVFDEKYSLRAGYSYSDQADYLFGFSAGGGLTFDLGETAMSFEFAWAETGDIFDANQYFTFTLQF